MYDAICEILQGSEFTVVESFEIAPRPARYDAVPDFLFSTGVGAVLQEGYPEGLWSHQSQALESLGRGENLVISTGTASGKSLIFQALAFHNLLSDPSSKVVVFYPLIALVADQLRSWNEMAHALGLEDGVIGRIDGTIPVKDRNAILENAKIVIMTPDVCHAWLMGNLAMPAVRNFVTRLSTVIMDEAHTLEGVFGSNVAFLIRRLLAARNHLLGNQVSRHPLQFVTATATIANPVDHLQLLSGAKFTVVDHDADGAPRFDRIVAHVASPPGLELQLAKELQDRVLSKGSSGGFITFVDSRKGVETLAIASQDDVDALAKHPEVSPYRAGYTSEQRQRIERRLRSGSLRGVVSTSALELGIDLPSLRVGFNVGIPPTRKAYRQRLGRVGRTGPGAFVVVATGDAFRRYGTSLQEYHDMSVEPSHLYLDNRFMQFAHSHCLTIERDSLAAPSPLPTPSRWPAGFKEIYGYALPSGNRPTEFDAIARLGGDTPHRGYPLRNIGDVNYQIKYRRDADSIGEASEMQALRECYPGATYYHNARAYEVLAWHTGVGDSFVRVKNTSPYRLTRPYINTWVNTAISASDIIQGHFLKGPSGFLAECLMLVTERVAGYIDGQGQFHAYSELQQHNANMRPRSRNFRTSGVVLCIDEPWFGEQEVKRRISDRLLEVFAHEYSIMANDLGSASTRINVRNVEGTVSRGRYIVIFDNTYGSLRFTEKLFLQFEHILGRLRRAAETDEEQGLAGFAELVDQVQDTYRTFVPGTALGVLDDESREGYEQLFTIGSRVCFHLAGKIASEVEIIGATIMDGNLMYQVLAESAPGKSPVRRWVPASACEPSADSDAWEYGWWNRETETYEDPSDAA